MTDDLASDRQTAFSGTREVVERLRFDVGRLESLFARSDRGLYRADRGEPIQGRPIQSDLSRGDRRCSAMRCAASRRAELLPSAHAVDREYRVISALHAQGFPVAAPVLYCADESVIGTAFFVMAYVEGRVFWEPHMPASDRGRARGNLRRHECDAGAAA